MNSVSCTEQMDYGGKPYLFDVRQAAAKNQNFRTAVWTGGYLQMTLMCIPPCGEIGLEVHEDTDQLIRVEQGNAVVKMGACAGQLKIWQSACKGEAVFVPAGTWHNVINVGKSPLRVSSVYAPPHHPKGTVHHTKKDAEREEK